MDQAIRIGRACAKDAKVIFKLQQCAYQTEAAIYDDYTIPPLVEKLDELRNQFRNKRFLKAMQGNRIIGSVRAFQKETTCYIERLIVHPEFRHQGVGTALLQQIERAYPFAARFELFTGHQSIKNLRLYERLGYRPFRQAPVNEKLTMVFLEKTPRRLDPAAL